MGGQLGSDGDDLWVGSWEVMEMTYGWQLGSDGDDLWVAAGK